MDSDAEILPIPNWLVDWICRDQTEYRSTTAKFSAARQKAKKAAAAAARAAGDQNAKSVSEQDIYSLVRSSSGYLARHGLDRDLIETCLLRLIEKSCDNGKEKAQSEGTKRLVHQIAYDKNLKIGTAPDFSDPFHKGFKVTEAYRSTKLVRLIGTFPDTIADSEAKRLVKEVWPDYDQDKNAHRVALHKARKKAGFTLTDDGRFWKRMVPLFVAGL
jgi:hypothetical protein